MITRTENEGLVLTFELGVEIRCHHKQSRIHPLSLNSGHGGGLEPSRRRWRSRGRGDNGGRRHGHRGGHRGGGKQSLGQRQAELEWWQAELGPATGRARAAIGDGEETEGTRRNGSMWVQWIFWNQLVQDI
jgi:hypothetical protein